MPGIQPKQIDFSAFDGFPSCALANKDMIALVTTADHDQACATSVAHQPMLPSSNGGYIAVQVNGVNASVGDGTRVGVDCYFSDDGGNTARLLQDVAVGDKLYWNGSIAGFQLAVTDHISFFYDVTT